MYLLKIHPWDEWILAAAEKRKVVMQRFDRYQSTILDHILKLCIYETDVCRHKWIEALAAKLILVSKMKVKPRNKHVTPNVLDYYIFDQFGDHPDDMLTVFDLWRDDNVVASSKYDDFEITDELCKRSHAKIMKLRAEWFKLLKSKKAMTQVEYEAWLHTIF